MNDKQRTPSTLSPRVSVIIIFLNGSDMLAEAIESVFNQTSDDWELLLCDDGSTDQSTELARRCAKQYPDKVRYLEHDGHVNLGMSATRNLGLRHAQGEYVSWLDSDDVWLPTKLEDQSVLLDQHQEAAMVFGPVEIWYSWTGNPTDFRRDFIQDVGLPQDEIIRPPDLLANFLTSDMHFSTGVMVRRDVLAEIGNFEEDFRGAFEDIIVHSKLALQYPVYFSSKTWYRYRQHPNQYCEGMRRARSKRMRRVEYLDRLMQYMLTNGFDQKFTQLNETIAQQRRHYSQTWRFMAADISKKTIWSFGEAVRGSLRLARRAGERFLPQRMRGMIGEIWYGRRSPPPRGWVHFGGLRRVTPISSMFGWDRGLPMDRYYIQQFLDQNRTSIHGRVMEVGETRYTTMFGDDRVEQAEVLHAVHGNPKATIVGDLATGEGIPRDAFDCVVLTQVLLCIWDVPGAIKNAAASLKPGGVLLVTLPGISQISRYDADRWGDFWRFTSQSIERLFAPHFPESHLSIQTYGNVLAATTFLYGLASDELTPEELAYRDPDFEMVIAIRAERPMDDTTPDADLGNDDA